MLYHSISEESMPLNGDYLNITKKNNKKTPDRELIIFEMANNHMGDVEHGIDIINELSKIKNKYTKYFNFAVKFQFRDLDTFIHSDFKGSNLKFIKRFESTTLKNKEWKILFDNVRKNNFQLLATPFDEISVNKIIKNSFDLIKIASCSLTDWPLLEKIASTKKEVIFSTAGSSIDEVDAVVSFFKNRNIPFTIMHCVGKYPTKDSQLNIGAIDFYKKRYPLIRVGFSTHESPTNISSAPIALAMGAKVFEKHVGIENKNYKLNDYSANPKQISDWLQGLKEAKLMIGNKEDRLKIKNEKKELRGLQRGVFLKTDIEKGKKINPSDLQFCIPSESKGLVANDISKYSEYISKYNIKKGTQLNLNNCNIIDNKKNILLIVKKIRNLLKKSGVTIPNGIDLEISHHYGIKKFARFGISMFNIVNYEYCKKIIVVLPKQKHPEQYHKVKKETFHVIYGNLELKLDGKLIKLNISDIVTIDPGVRHEFYSKNGCIIEELSSNHNIDDSFYTDKDIMKNNKRKTFVKFWR